LLTSCVALLFGRHGSVWGAVACWCCPLATFELYVQIHPLACTSLDARIPTKRTLLQSELHNSFRLLCLAVPHHVSGRSET
jgi:hypothetical protein